jgi:AraC-like DNA-binding protein/quercetin dioxygenase-like cupin family protein
LKIGGVDMSIEFLRSPSASSATFRVVCGEMIIDDKWIIHNEVAIAHVREGSLTMETITSTYSLHRGDIYFISPNQKYRVSGGSSVIVDVILLNLSNPAAVTQEFIPQSVIRGLTTGNCTHFAKLSPTDAHYIELLSDFTCVVNAEQEKFDFFQLLVHGKMYNMFYIFFSSGLIKVFDVETQGKKYRALRKITEYINDNFCDNLSLDTIAEETGLSRYYISHLFKELMNTTFIGYLNELRLTRAATLLTTTDTPVIEIAGISGFNNISNFNRAFKMYYDTTPSKYRKNERQPNYK